MRRQPLAAVWRAAMLRSAYVQGFEPSDSC